MIRIKRPSWFIDNIKWPEEARKAINEWYFLEAEPINKMLDEAVEVYGSNKRPLDGWNEKSYESTSHKALLINIQPIEKETAEDVLRDFTNYCVEVEIPESCDDDPALSLYKRAKAVLGE